MTPQEIYTNSTDILPYSSSKSNGFSISYDEYEKRQYHEIKRQIAEIPWKKQKSKEHFAKFLKTLKRK